MILPTQKPKCHIWMNQTEDFLQHPGAITQQETHNRNKLKYCLPLSVDSCAAAAYCNLNFLHTLSADYQMSFREMLLAQNNSEQFGDFLYNEANKLALHLISFELGKPRQQIKVRWSALHSQAFVYLIS